jgi:hypothetical protein
MKKLFEISSEEKQRILEMHESATKRNYLSELDTTQATTKPVKTTQIIPGAESVESFIIPRDFCKVQYGIDLQKIIDEYRQGITQGYLIGKDKPYLWSVEQDDSKLVQFQINELFKTGSLDRVQTVTYYKDSKSWGQQYLRPDSEKVNTDKVTDEYWKPTFFWRGIVNDLSQITNSLVLTRFLQASKQMNQPYNLKDMINKKSQLYVNPESDISQQTIDNIKSSLVYKTLAT